mmetsp:Transcript_2376/g.5615  ORF Transcript_2376/g.5615 Transcript_2376/m.5615 type:complete len:231 (-) Transcript_2376:349-1041(-)
MRRGHSGPSLALEVCNALGQRAFRGRVVKVLQEGVPQEVPCRGAVLRRLLQARRDKVLERLREGALQLRGGVLGDEEEHPHRVELGVGRRPRRHLDRRDAEGPYVRLLAVTLLARLDHLGRHPERGPDEGLALVAQRAGQLAGDPKVAHLHAAVLREKDVGCFDVTVDAILPVEVDECAEDLAQDQGHHGLVQDADLEEICYRASHELHHYQQLRRTLRQEGCVVLRNVR